MPIRALILACALFAPAPGQSPTAPDGPGAAPPLELRILPADSEAVLDGQGPPSVIGARIATLAQALAAAGLPTAGPPSALYLDAPGSRPDPELRFQVRFPLSVGAGEGDPATPSAGGDERADTLGFRIEEQPARRVAAIRHEGPYSELAALWADFARTLASRGLRAIGPPREIYLRPPGDSGRAPLTELQWVLATPTPPADPAERFAFGIYSGAGASPTGIEAASICLERAGLHCLPLGAADLNDGSFRHLVRAVYFPGGWAADYVRDIDADGARELQDFVENGGGYLGICAGSYYAARRIRWEGVSYPYDLDLFPGVPRGPLQELAPWPHWTEARLELNPDHPITRGLVPERSVLYYGGPALDPRPDSGAVVLARFAKNDAPAVVALERGRGRVFLSAAHLEYDFGPRGAGAVHPHGVSGISDPESDQDFLLAGARWLLHRTAPLRVPAYSGYAEPDPQSMERNLDGSVPEWSERLSWYGRFPSPGKLSVVVRLLPDAPPCALRLELSPRPEGRSSFANASGAAGATELRFPELSIPSPGYYRLSLSPRDLQTGRRPGVRALLLSGPAARDAHFSTVERRNAPSVHLHYPVPEAARGEVEWFYCELTPRSDPLWTYYEACGWHRGYFGMQVNGPDERRIIFSVWDAGNEKRSRDKVAVADRVRLLAKGEGVHAGGFGNEGTGGHSHLVYDWKRGSTYRFLLHAEVHDGKTVYSGWFYFPERRAWGLIASFEAPRDGRLPHGLYSFNEDFGGANGQERRICEFHDPWVRTRDGEWYPLEEARFTFDDHGRAQRLDRSAGVIGDRFYLANGGFVDDPNPTAVSAANAVLHRSGKADGHPSDAELPRR